jgi:hypothetical protein
LRNEFALAEKQFLLAKDKNRQNFNPGRYGLIRARIKLGKTAETYRELGANSQVFQEIAVQCMNLKDGPQLDRLLTEHRKAVPAAKNLAAWDVEALWLKKEYQGVIEAIDADKTLLKSATYRWKCESHLVRSYVRLKKPNDALRVAEAFSKRANGPTTLLPLALAASGDVKGLLGHLESKRTLRYIIDDCYRDEDLGPLLRSEAFKEVRAQFPPPTNIGPIGRFDDDWD